MPSESQPPITDLSRFVEIDKDGMRALQLMVGGIRCASCAFLIENTLNKEPDVNARVNLTSRRLTVRWRGEASRGDELAQIVAALGYKVTPFDAKTLKNDDRSEETFLLRCLAVSGFATGNIMLLSVALWSATEKTMGISTRDLMHALQALIAIPTTIYAGRPFFRPAWEALRHGRTNMDVPISVALVLTTAMSVFEGTQHGTYAYFDSVVMLLFLLLIGRWLDRRTRGRAKAAAENLLMMMAGTATIRSEDGKSRLIPIRELQSGMLLLVAMGEKIAADGVVEKGRSEIDPSFITGETLTQPVQEGSAVYGGMVNLLAPMEIRITAASGKSLLGEVIKLMEKAEQGHARYVRLADRVARYYTPVVHILALGTFLIWRFALGGDWQQALLNAMTVLIITCPCALGLAVPAVQVLASGHLFKRGMLLKSADALEKLAAVDAIVFDKTGTLTRGTPRLVNPAEIGARNMQVAASMAAYSRHPLAKCLHGMYGGKFLPMTVKETPGEGLEARLEDGKIIRLGKREWATPQRQATEGGMELWLAIEDAQPVRFAFEDDLRADSREVIAALKKQGYMLTLLSGDREDVAQAVAKELGIEDVRARVTPLDKNNAIESLRKQGKRVLMVGDGLNDAPALAAADVSMSPSSALDITQNAADIVFQGDKLMPVAEALATAKRAHRLVKENFALSLLYNLLAVPLAMVGLVTPLIAAIAMSSSSILVVANAQRVARKQRKPL
ncbi:MAG: heavy metal translocating P-type ATPase [Bdellovibrionales bacterium]